jgi:AP2-associated kinase
LLDTKQHVSTSRTAEGYGKYTDERKALPPRPDELSKPPLVARKPVLNTVSGAQLPPRPSQAQSLHSSSSSAPPAAYRAPPGSSGGRPSAPPKPKALRTGGGQAETLPGRASVSRDKPLPVPGGEAEGDDWDMASFSKRYPSLSGLEMVETEIGYASGKTPGSRTSVRDV